MLTIVQSYHDCSKQQDLKNFIYVSGFFCAGPILIITAINFRIINYQTIVIVSFYKSDSRGPQKVRSSRPTMLESGTPRSFPEVLGIIEVWCRHSGALACLFVNYQQ